ncbi:ribonuclease III [Robiginitomaculum antarcticum]|uniref:ribonuclease III n=1 Tax=Robiginitomaculum antarcticum TaxID=437507 RepID=UPI000379C92D|nr:ribonuclease III [Robiginitomaculum antarcticum]
MSQNLALKRLQERLNYTFSNPDLLQRAMTHSSYGDGRRNIVDNERLEFLGDRVLGLLTAERLFMASSEKEGQLARKLNSLVRKEACARAARRAMLGDVILMSQAEDKQGGREKISILGDVCEALLGALYLDGGMEAASKFYEAYWSEELAGLEALGGKDPKTELQELASAMGKSAPEYTVIERSGPDHRPLYVIQVAVANLGMAQGTGKSKKDAERFAARHLLESLNT